MEWRARVRWFGGKKGRVGMDEEDGQKDGRVGASSPTRPAHFAW